MYYKKTTFGHLNLKILLILLIPAQFVLSQRINFFERQWDEMNKKIMVSYANSNLHYNKYRVPDITPVNELKIKAWRGEKINALILIWSDQNVKNISLTSSDLIDKHGNKINKSDIKLSFVNYVWTDGYFGNGCSPRNNKMLDSMQVADMIDTVDNVELKARTVQPVWVSVEVPRDIPASSYTGRFSIMAGRPIEMTFSIDVNKRILPTPNEWKFELDIWQFPVPIARYHNLSLWSDQHFNIMRPYFKMLSGAGQKVITVSMIDGGNQGKELSPAMIRFIKKKDGSWQYDYSLFDKYVAFMMDCGIKKRINCYSMVPWKLEFGYYDEALAKDTFMTAMPGTAEYKDYWIPMLKSFTAHLKEKKWFDIACIAMDERKLSDMQAVIKIIRDVDPAWKIALAGSYHEELMHDVYDYSVFRSFTFTSEQLNYRNKNGMASTFYTSCEGEKPNMFTFSPPAESAWMGWYAAAKGFNGYLRWAYNLWNDNPLHDSRGIYPAGDFYQIYPGPKSSVRFEKMIEGIQDFEKINILRNSLGTNTLSRLDKVLSNFEVERLDQISADEMLRKAKSIIQQY